MIVKKCPGLVGRDSAAPILFDAFARISPRPEPLRAPAAEKVVPLAELPPALRRFQAKGAFVPVLDASSAAVAISFPADGARVDLGATESDLQPLAMKAAGGTPPFSWMVDGHPIGPASHRRQTFWRPKGKGFARLTVVDDRGHSASSTIRID